MLTKVIVISGAPASGKSGLAIWLSTKTGIPVISKDSIKERLFDRYGYSDRSWSRHIGKVGFALLVRRVIRKAAARQSFIIESTFRKKDGELFAELLNKFKIIHVSCALPDEHALSRFKERAAHVNRHPGHVDQGNSKELESQLRENVFSITIPHSECLHIPTVDYRSDEFLNARERVLAAYAR